MPRGLRRCNSATSALDREREEKKFLEQMETNKRIHENRESAFSTASGFNNFRGLLNLGIILLVVSNGRVALENILKYGILIDPLNWGAVFLMDPYYWPSVNLTMMIPIYVLLVFAIEKANTRSLLSEVLSCILIVTICCLMLIIPSWIIVYRHPNPVPFSNGIFSGVALMLHVIVFLKLWSYSQTNYWYRKSGSRLRRRRRSASAIDDDDDSPASTTPHLCRYPDNINLPDLVYFLMAPTLCYEVNFPRNIRIRKRFLAKRVLELIFLPQVMMGLIQQWIMPLLHNSLEPFSKSDYSRSLERLLKLAIPNHLIWLIFFYVTFHSALNVLGEILLFSDRQFYKDWWNSTTVLGFWSTWNMPVHRFCHRHIYLPLLRYDVSRLAAAIVVFLISASFHELLLSVPLRIFRVWAFMGMIAQVPFALFVSWQLKDHPQLGNVCVWVSLILGQPLVILTYFHDYYIQNFVTDK